MMGRDFCFDSCQRLWHQRWRLKFALGQILAPIFLDQACTSRGAKESLNPMAWMTLNSVSELGARSPERLL